MNAPPIFAFFWRSRCLTVYLIISNQAFNEWITIHKVNKIRIEVFYKDSLMMFIREELFSIIDKDQLPCQYDGSCCCKMDSILFDERGSVIYILLVNNW